MRIQPFLLLALVGLSLKGFTAENVSDFLPQSVDAAQFSALQVQSPFTRSLNLSDSLILTGVARVDGNQMATLLNKETKETFVVSSAANSQGWKMVDLKANDDLEKVAATISVDGGQVVTVRYAEWQMKPGEARPGGGGGGGESTSDRGGRKDGERRGPSSPETREKLSKLSDEQKGKLFGKMKELHEKNPEMSREERGKVFQSMLDKISVKK